MTRIDLQRMSRAEKLGLMHAIWEDLVRDEDAVESPAWHREVLRETEERLRHGVEKVQDWTDAKAELRKRAG